MRCIFAHQRDVYVTFDTKLQLMTLLIAHKKEPCSPIPGRKTWLLLAARGMSCGLRNPFYQVFNGQSSVNGL